MNKEQIRLKVRECVANLIDDVGDADLDLRLDRTYQFAIPDNVDGLLTEDTWTFETEQGVGAVAFPAFVHSVKNTPNQPPLLDDSPLCFFRRPYMFYRGFPRESVEQSRPSQLLVFGRWVTLRAIPDAAYSVYLDVRARPHDGEALLSLPNAGTGDETHDLAIAYGTAAEWLAELGMWDHFAVFGGTVQERALGRWGGLFGQMLSQLRVQSHATPPTVRPRRSF